MLVGIVGWDGAIPLSVTDSGNWKFSHELKRCSAVYNDMKTGFIAVEFAAEVELQRSFC